MLSQHKSPHLANKSTRQHLCVTVVTNQDIQPVNVLCWSKSYRHIKYQNGTLTNSNRSNSTTVKVARAHMVHRVMVDGQPVMNQTSQPFAYPYSTYPPPVAQDSTFCHPPPNIPTPNQQKSDNHHA